jgi:apolipoprotein N-acyltransferase
LLALLSGGALLAGHDPIGWGWVGLVALVPLSLLARAASGSPRPVAAGLGWGLIAGGAFFAPLLWWINHIGEIAAWPLLTTFLALYVAAWVALMAWWGERRGRAVVAVAAWVAVEALRTVAPFGGFPWGQLGYTQANAGPLLEAARTVGVLGVTGLLAAVAIAIERGGVAVTRALGAQRERGDEPRQAVLPGGEHIARAGSRPLAAAVGLLVLGTLLFGTAPEPTGETVDIAAVQGFDVTGSTGRSLGRSRDIAHRQLEVTRRLATGPAGPPDLAVWPESAFDNDVVGADADPRLRETLTEALGVLDGAPLLTGVIDERPGGRFANNTVAFDADGDVVGRYTKRHYVPFGEYIPLRGLLEWIPPLERVPRDGVVGQRPEVTELAGAGVGSLICFEVLWPELVHEPAAQGAQVLVMATNNSSFGRSAASDQHIAVSQLRAVETGRWIVHAALSGRSALVAPDGSVHQRTGLYQQAVVRDEVPLVEGKTLAMRLNAAPGWVAVIVLAGMLGWAVTARRRAFLRG